MTGQSLPPSEAFPLSLPLDDRDTLSHHTHHKDDAVPVDDRDFDSVHTHHEEDPSVPLDDRDFDSRHTKRPRVVVGTDEQKMRNLERPVDETGELDDLEVRNDGTCIIADKTDGAVRSYLDV